ncbi:hypothetical protein MPY17_40570 (plasmid) [Rhodococcus opacus]|nr:hypothetical protein [Rhodococcus opacus]UUK33967.1 hypothetical protein MPY17_40570 [Rhodococcus opacus]
MTAREAPDGSAGGGRQLVGYVVPAIDAGGRTSCG